MPTVYLISGANRGIGLAFVQALLKRPDVVVFAGARDPSSPSLVELAKQHPGIVEPVKLSSGGEEDNKAAAALIKEKYGKIDVVIANAGIATGADSAAASTVSEFTDNFNTNVLGPLILFQSTLSLLKNASAIGKFVVISSTAGSSTHQMALVPAAYGTSKAAVNFLTTKIQFENPDLIAFPLCPGLVSSDMGNQAADKFSLPADAFITPDVSVGLLLEQIDAHNAVVSEPKTYWSAMDGGQDVTF